MRKRFISILQYSIFLGGGIFLVWWQLRSMDDFEKEQFYTALHQANYWLIAPVILMSLLSHFSRAMRWKLLMQPLDYNPKLKNLFAVTLIGYLVNAAIPRLGEVVKCSLLARYEKLKVDKLVGTILVERAFDLVCYIIFIAITVFIQVNVIGAIVRQKLTALADAPGMPLWVKIFLVAGIIAFIVWLSKFLLRKFPENRIIKSINNFEKGIIDGFRSIRKLRQRRAFILHTLFIWSMYLLQIYVAFFAMNATEHLNLKAAFSVLTLATLAMIATPNGIGTFPIFVKEALLVYGIAAPLGQAFGSLVWGVSTTILLIAGVTALLALPIMNRSKYEINSVNS